MKVLLVLSKKGSATGIAVWGANLMATAKNMDNIEIFEFNDDLYKKQVEQGGYFGGSEPEMKNLESLEKELLDAISENKIEIVHLNLMTRGFEVKRNAEIAQIVKKSGCKIVVEFHCNIEEFYDKNNEEDRLWFDKLMSLADLSIATVRTAERFLKTEYPNSNCEYLPNFLGAESFYTDRKYGRIKTVMNVGNMEENTGALDVIELARQYPEIRFKMIGGLEKNFEQKIAKIDLPSNITFYGRQTPEKLKEHWVETDLFLFPTHYQGGFSMALLEAMEQGLPCLASGSPSSREILRKNLVFQTFEFKNFEDLMVKFESLVSLAPEKIEELGVINLNTARENYFSETVVTKLVGLYCNL